MLLELAALCEAYEAFLPTLPWWGSVIYFVIHLITVLVCFGRDGFHPFDESGKHGNTLNSIVWFCVLLAFPVIGVVLYYLLGIPPYVRWRKKHPGAKCPFVFVPDKTQYVSAILAGFAAYLIQDLLSKQVTLPFVLAFEIPMIIWVLFAAYQCMTARSTVLFLKPIYAEPVSVSGGTIFGKPCKREYAEPPENKRYARMEACAARAAFVSDRTLDSQEIPYHITVNSMDFHFMGMIAAPNVVSGLDVIESRYVGRGVTRVTYLDWTKDRDSCTERHAYLTARPVGRIAVRMVLLLFVIFVLFLPAFAELHIGIVNKVQEIIGNFMS